MVYVILADGFEEIEAVAPIDIMRRVGIEVLAVSITDILLVRGGHDIYVNADITLDEIDFEALEMLVLPGGLGGVEAIGGNQAAMDLILRVWSARKKLAAICAAPSLLASLGILDGLAVVCHPSVSDKIEAAGGQLCADLSAVSDNGLVTGKAAGTSLDFGLEIVAVLRGQTIADELRHSMYVQGVSG